ncbi:hypothetical protein DSM112329_04417 [Paraconexibacter sp. AEG42_29]|uniref:Phage shock protein PspC N-terminal domain-containing protein n=1 Tax=Paraconexibacter sp. AEG42_29 TaxID=2997339 RepID=A0AAU7B0X7_9ACTN
MSTSPTPVHAVPTLRRASGERRMLGLCAGIAQALDVPVLAVRLAVLLGALVAPGLTLVAYATGALIVPDDDGRGLLGGRPVATRDALLGWGLVGIAGIVLLAGDVGINDGVRGVLAGPLLLGGALAAGWVLLRGTGHDTAAAPGPGLASRPAAGPAPMAQAPAGSPAPATTTTAAWPAPGHAAAPATPTAAARGVEPTLRHATADPPADVVDAGRPVAPYVFGALALGTATFGALVVGGGVAVTTSRVAGLLAAVTAGVALTAIATAGRRGTAALLALAVLLGTATLAVAALPDQLRGGIGARTERPAAASDLQDRYRLGVGSLDIDLRDTRLPRGTTTVRGAVGVGNLTIWVPAGVRVRSIGPTLVTGVDRVNRAERADRTARAVAAGKAAAKGRTNPAAGRGSGKAKPSAKAAGRTAPVAAPARTLLIDADTPHGSAAVLAYGP